MLVVVIGRLAEGDQIGGRGDLVRVVRLVPSPPLYLACSRQDEQTRGQR